MRSKAGVLSGIVLLALLAFLAFASPALGAKGKAGTGGPPTGCTVQAYSYDTGGAPGSGAVNDPLFPRQWGLDQINAPEAWARGARGAGTVIAIVDTGVDLNHPTLHQSSFRAPTSLPASVTVHPAPRMRTATAPTSPESPQQ